jgi:hypothetical protein
MLGANGVQKMEVTSSMIGFHETLRFYPFEKEKAVLVIGDLKLKDFTDKATVYVPSKDA